MSRPKLLLLLLSAALAAGVVLIVSGVFGEGESPGDTARPDAALPVGEGGGAEDLVAVAGGTRPMDTAELAVESTEPERRAVETSAPRPTWAAEGEQWLEGTVELLPGTPDDEVLYVVATDQPLGVASFQNGPGAVVWSDEPEFEPPYLSSAAVAEDGSFRIALPAGASEAHLGLTGRYTFTRGTTTIDLAATEAATLSGELGAWVTGSYRDPSGSLIAGLDDDATIGMGADLSAGFDPEKLRTEHWGLQATDGPDGTGFQFRGVNPALPHSLVVAADGFAPSVQVGLDLRPGQHLEIDVPLARGTTLSGRAIDERGAPLAGVEVSVTVRSLMGKAIGAMRETETGADGNFVLENGPTGPLDLTASLEGYRTTRLPLERELGEGESLAEIVLVIGRGASIAGRASYADGSPAAGAEVQVSLPPNPFGGFEGMQSRLVAEVEVGAEGRFEVTGLAEAPHDLEARIERSEGDEMRFWKTSAKDVSPSVDGGAELELVLQEIVPLRGQVVDVEGAPVPAFRVVASQDDGSMFGMGIEFEERSFETEDGRFVFDELGPGTWDVAVHAEGFGSSEPQVVVAPPEEGAEDLVFVLELAAAVEGIVIDTSGAPAPGAKVTLELAMAERIQAELAGGMPTVRSDEEGRFRLEDVNPGSLDLVAMQEGFAASAPVACEAAPGVVVSDIVLELRVGGTLTGELYGDDGEPAAGQTVIVQNMPSYSKQHLPITETDGTFRVEHLEPGNWQVVTSTNFMTGDPDKGADQAMADFMSTMKTEFVEIVDGEESHVVLGALGEAPVRFHGQVLHAGEPAADELIVVMPDDAGSLAALKMNSTDAEGRFEFTLDRPGAYTVGVQDSGAPGQQNQVEYRETIPEGVDEHEMVIELPTGRISGRVRGPDGEPLPGARVTLFVEGGAPVGSYLGTRYADTNADGEGNYDLRYLPPGSYTVGAGGLAMGGVLGGESNGGRLLQSGLEVGAGQWIQGVDFQLRNPGILTGRVLDPNGQPVADASVFVRDAQGRLVEHFSMLSTDFNGRFTHGSLAPGEYTVEARTLSGASTATPVTLREDESTEATLTVTPGTVFIVTVLDANNEDVAAHLSATDDDGQEIGTMRSMQELMGYLALEPDTRKHRIGPVAPGRYTLIATTDDGRRAKRTLTVNGQPERKIKLRVK